MGISYEMFACVGIIYGDYLQEKVTSETITRYDENTGKPYDKIIKEVKWEFGKFTMNDGEEYIGEIECSFPKGLDVFYGGYESGPEKQIIGSEIIRGDLSYGEGSPYELTFDEIDAAKKKAKMQLKEIGIECEPKLYVGGSCG